MSARNLWSPLAEAFIDVRVFNPQAKANWEKSIPQMYKSLEEEKKQVYLPRVLQVENQSQVYLAKKYSDGYQRSQKEVDKIQDYTNKSTVL